MWSMGVWMALLLSAGIGVSLGLVGGGGSIITVPVLVYVAGLPVQESVALSLAIVGATAAVGAMVQARAGNVHLPAALIFSATGMAGALVGSRLTALVPPPVLMAIFALLMVLVGVAMLRGRSPEVPRRAECNFWKCGLTGLSVGGLTGFLGVGGGFLIVPALLRLAKLPMRMAVGTSMAIIAANSASGLAAHLADVQGRLPMAVGFTVAALAGLAAGLGLGRRLQPAGLKAVFGSLTLLVATYLIVVNVGPLANWIAHGR